MERIVRLTEQELSKEITDAIKVISEGIDVDANGNVLMTDKHERLVDTSITNNPTLLTDFVPNIHVWSIFKRKDDDWGDGNPLLYALKGEKGYKLKNEKKFYNRLNYIINKFFKENKGIDVTIAVPSQNKLNDYFARIIANHCQNPRVIDNLLVKMSTGEVAEFVMAEDSVFRKHYGHFYSQAFTMLKQYFRKMSQNMFQFHKVEDMEMRGVIEKTIKISDEFYGDYVDAINGKNIVIVDDSLSLGNTIRESCRIIAEAYTPKSISVITIFSPLYTEHGTDLKNRK